MRKDSCQTSGTSGGRQRGDDPSAPPASFGQLALAAAVGGLAAVVISRNFLETEKKLAEMIVTDYSVKDPPFVRTMSQLLGPPLLGGNKVISLQNGVEIFPRMIEAVRSAERSITFENFVLVDGHVARSLADAMCERARNGVKVHFLQDALGCNCLHGDLMGQLKAAGVEVEIFRYYNLTRFNHRTHRKLLVVDGKLGFVGGVGISDAWDGNADRPDRWRDSQYEVHGPVVGQMQQAFLDNWVQTRSCVLHGDDYFPALAPIGDTICQIFKSSVTESADSARLMFLFSIAAARETIRIANPYFIPDGLVSRMLVEARRRGVEIEIMAPSERIDQRVVRYVGRSTWGPLLAAGIRFFEYQPALLHCKYLVVDGHWSSVGSCNLDDRSLCLNEEANLNVWDPGFAQEHMRVFDADKQHCDEVTLRDWQRRSWRERTAAGAAWVLRSQL